MRAKRTDANLTPIIEAFRKLGCSVDVTNDLWDLTVGLGGQTILIEVKDGSKPPSARKLTKRSRLFAMTWKGGYKVVENLDGVTETVALLRDWSRRLRV